MNDYLILNRKEKNIKVSNKLNELISKADTFYFSVAFITDSGLRLIENKLNEFFNSGKKGQIITSSYQLFTEPNALKKLFEYKNLELKIITNEIGIHHSKGYYFETKENYSAIIGSSNLTANALTSNIEWNVLKSGKLNDSFHGELSKEFSDLWNIATPVTETFIQEYETKYQKNFSGNRHTDYSEIIIVPNKMQEEALTNLANIRKADKKKALIISATGTGKTYLAAFDVNEVKPKKCLFIVHRETILNDAVDTFRKVIKDKSMGKFTGTKRELENDYIFATIQTISREENLRLFSKNEFDYIIVDEVHHAGAATYKRITGYFEPSFLLGMSATPERNDGFDIFALFDHTIAVEIRLEQAMKFDLITDFHYYGVNDIDLPDSKIDKELSIEDLTVDERVRHIIEKSKEYGFSGKRLKGLIFCSRVEEAEILAEKINKYGFKTLALSGKNSNDEREKAIERLEQDNSDGNQLDFILTVDIFNEGVDIPSVNQVILLRETESAIVFVQQIGRGLRKNYQKDFCVIIDFIANYKKNYLISVALSGDRSYKKDTLRKFVFDPNKDLYGASTIYFEEIVKTKLLENIDKTSFQQLRFLKDEYFKLKNKIGHIPEPLDFLLYDSIDLGLIIKKYNSYYNFLVAIEEEKITLSTSQQKFLELVSTKLSNGKKIEDLLAVDLILKNKFEDLFNELKKDKRCKVDTQTEIYLTNLFTNNYFVSGDKYKYLPFLKSENGIFILSSEFKDALEQDKENIFRKQLENIVNFGIKKYTDEYQKSLEDDQRFALYKTYSYEDVVRILEWRMQMVSLNIGGYKYDKDTQTFPIFVNYDKEEDIPDTTQYNDYFKNENVLEWFSKSKRNRESPEIKIAENHQNNNYKFFLFVRKNKDDQESKEFYYLGRVAPKVDSFEMDKMRDGSDVVKMELLLNNMVENSIYNYITRG